MNSFEYMVGGLPASVTIEDEQSKLAECAAGGWQLVAVSFQSRGTRNYIMYYFRKEKGNLEKTKPRFDLNFAA
jgi:hypothetical protein